MSADRLNHHQEARIQSDLANITFREPIVSDYPAGVDNGSIAVSLDERRRRLQHHLFEQEVHEAAIDTHWLAVTEAGRRAILGSPDVRSATMQVAALPLREQLPSLAVTSWSSLDTRTGRLAASTRRGLATRLELAVVPDELLKPDISHAPRMTTRESAEHDLGMALKYGPDGYDRRLANTYQSVQERPGVSQAERRLVAQRYRFGRDVKLLGLLAELHDNPIIEPRPVDGVVRNVLPSGIELSVTADALAADPNLLQPQAWQSRRQLKDRVFAVQIGDKQYIQKERKTVRHTDTKEDGHIDGLTAAEEFETALQFSRLGTVREADISLQWETPVGYAVFPDGYQFCLFESAGDLHAEHPYAELQEVILADPETYREEYAAVRSRVKQLFQDRPDLIADAGPIEPDKPRRFALTPAARRRNREAAQKPVVDELSYDEFAATKARTMVLQAEQLLARTMYEQGFVNQDRNGQAFTVRPGKPLQLAVTAFDLEYYEHRPEETRSILLSNQERDASGESTNWLVYSTGRGAQYAKAKMASYAMLEGMGITLPPA